MKEEREQKREKKRTEEREREKEQKRERERKNRREMIDRNRNEERKRERIAKKKEVKETRHPFSFGEAIPSIPCHKTVVSKATSPWDQSRPTCFITSVAGAEI